MLSRLIAVALITLAAAGCASSPARDKSNAADLAALATYNKQYLQSINDGDIATLSRLTADEHIMLPPGRKPTVGKAANDAANGSAFEKNKFDEHWYPLETVVSGDWAYERGTFTTDVMPKDGSAKRSVGGNYMRIYRRQPDGGWKMIRDMFNSDKP